MSTPGPITDPQPQIPGPSPTPTPDPPSAPPPTPNPHQAAAAAPAYHKPGRATSDMGGSVESPPNSGPMYALGAAVSASTPLADEDHRLVPRDDSTPAGPWTWTECPNLLPA